MLDNLPQNARSVRTLRGLAAGGAIVAALALAPGAAADTAPNGSIAYASNADGDYDIYTSAPDASAPVNLTDGEAGPDDTTPAWSPDGTRIAFASTREGDWDIWVMDADGSSLQRLTGPGDQTSPTWSADGTKLAFDNDVDGDLDVYTMNADGTDEANVTGPRQDIPYDDMLPDWSPTGDRILFQGVRDGAWELLSMRPDGSDEVNLTAEDNPPWANQNWAPSFNPDGTKIVYSSQPNNGGNEWDVWVMNADGTGKENVLPDEEWQDLYGTWSPDGTKIVFQSNRSGDSNLFAIDYPAAVAAATRTVSTKRTRRAARTATTAAAPDQVTTLGGTTAADWGRRPPASLVRITADGVDPGTVEIAQGGAIRWRNDAATEHGAEDASGLGLFDSGLLAHRDTHTYRPRSAGTYLVRDPVGAGSSKFAVPVVASPRRGLAGQTFTLFLATRAPGAGWAFDVEIRRPGASAWSTWRDDYAARAIRYAAPYAGKFAFRARLVRLADGRTLRWSPPVTINAR
jgi:hypothetical protein